jgi:hypothetical protein
MTSAVLSFPFNGGRPALPVPSPAAISFLSLLYEARDQMNFVDVDGSDILKRQC